MGRLSTFCVDPCTLKAPGADSSPFLGGVHSWSQRAKRGPSWLGVHQAHLLCEPHAPRINSLPLAVHIPHSRAMSIHEAEARVAAYFARQYGVITVQQAHD